eukprot:c2466_g1_i2.p1 GENE.c2466_g1_i2~~c2466_g1_i2.p1  ORF type:complete len:242 (+),score=55.21 c2466_g1_i2:50-775(+)
MKFRIQLKTSQINRWKEHYLDYDMLKKLMYEKFPKELKKNQGESKSNNALQVEMMSCVYFKDDFELAIDEETQRVNQFFVLSLKNFSTEAQLLISNHEQAQEQQQQQPQEQLPFISASSKHKYQSLSDTNLVSTRHAIIDLYRRFHYLRSFAVVNYTAFVKLLRKHDKLATEAIERQPQLCAKPQAFHLVNDLLPAIETLEFYNWALIDEQLSRLEDLFAGMFCQDNKLVARGELLITQVT